MPSISAVSAEFAAKHLTKAMEHYKIDSPRRIAMFLAQLAHESNSLKDLSENLNYSAEGLLKVFPEYFNEETAKLYARNPEKIANRVYANRYGNGNEASGDGWRYRGAGAMQLTFKDNHARAAKEFGKSLEELGDWLRTVPGACWSAAWFWHVNAINTVADKPDTWRGSRNGFTGLDPFDYTTVIINGGQRGAAERRSKHAITKKALGIK